MHVASRFRAHVRVARDGRVIDGKSIMGILLLAAAHGTIITISADGADEQEALNALCDLVAEGIWRRVVERLTGIGVSPGVAVGRAVILTLRTEAIRFPIPPDRVAREVAALHAAREQSRQQLQDIRDRVRKARGVELAAIFDAQLLMLDDALFVGRAEEIIREERVNAAWAVHRAYEELGAVFASVEDEYLRERENDVADVAGRLRLNLRHGARGARDLLSELDGPSILVADELTASLAAQLDWTRIQGFALDAGSRTYHTAILARSLKVPAVVGLHDASSRIRAGTPLILDGTTGELDVDPPPETLESRAAPRRRRLHAPSRRAARLAPSRQSPPTASASGCRPTSSSSKISSSSASTARRASACIARSSCSRVARSQARRRTRNTRSIARLIEQVAPQPVTIRTFDVDERQLGARTWERRAPAGACAACALASRIPRSCARSCARSSAPACTAGFG